MIFGANSGKKLLLLNSVCGTGSTGRICESIADEYTVNGWEVRIAYGRASGRNLNKAEKRYGHRIGTDIDVRLHGLITRVYDLHGFGSKRATQKFLRWADEYNPDMIWLHNIHGYYLNVKEFFLWIKQR